MRERPDTPGYRPEMPPKVAFAVITTTLLGGMAMGAMVLAMLLGGREGRGR